MLTRHLLSNNNRGADYSAPHNIEEENKMRSKLTYKEIEQQDKTGDRITGAICFVFGLLFTYVAWSIGIPLVNDLYELSAVALFGAIGITVSLCGLAVIWKHRNN